MNKFSFLLFCLSFLTFCAVAVFCVLLLLYPAGLFHPVIASDVKILELGTIDSDKDVDCRFEIKNMGNRELLLREAVPACGSGHEINVVDFSLDPLLPGEQRTLNFRFHPYALRDKVLKKLVVLSNDPKSPRLVLSVTATVNHVPPPETPPPILAPIILL
jgi:hypothetical protein